MAGYSSGSSSGLALGLGRGLLGAVGLPLSGALDLVSSISTGIANTAGISHNPKIRRPPLRLGENLEVRAGAPTCAVLPYLARRQSKKDWLGWIFLLDKS